MENAIQVTQATFGPMVETCRAYGISRTVAFDLARKGLIEHFSIGSRRYVYIDSLNTLPDRLAKSGGKK
ncbi:MAG: hypothetical protein RLZZ537_191 [Pseudomonadota bacterium]|jgi:hypothetical protein